MSDAHRYFATGVSMITSGGAKNSNVMAAEWTMQISYDPMLIAIFIHKGSVTLKNITKTKEFGVNMASDEQSTAISTAGGFSRIELDKLLITDVFKTVKPKKIKTPLIQGCVISAECKVVMKKTIGDHVMIVGKVVRIRHDKTKKPLIYHRNRYFQIGLPIEPDRKKISVNTGIFEAFKRESQGKFILKYIGIVIKSKHGILTFKQKNFHKMIPLIKSPRKMDYKKHLEKYLQENGLDVSVMDKPVLRRVILVNKQKVQRINFVLFVGHLKTNSKNFVWEKDNKFLNSLL